MRVKTTKSKQNSFRFCFYLLSTFLGVLGTLGSTPISTPISGIPTSDVKLGDGELTSKIANYPNTELATSASNRQGSPAGNDSPAGDGSLTVRESDLVLDTTSIPLTESQVMERRVQDNRTLIDHQRLIEANQGIAQIRGYASSCQTDSVKRICSCDSSCTVQSSCCYDSEFVNLETLPDSPFKCFNELNAKWLLESPSLLMADCPAEWTDNGIRQNCIHSSLEHLYKNIPCYSNNTRLTYKNVDCALCNGVKFSELIPWRASFRCIRPTPFDFVDTLEKMSSLAERPLTNRRGCQFVATEPDPADAQFCIPVAISTCNRDYNRSDTDYMRRACRAYLNPVSIKDSTFYQNIHCLRCNTEEAYRKAPVEPTRSPLGRLSLILNVNPGRNMNTDKKWPPCMPDETKTAEGGCGRLVAKIRGYMAEFVVNVSIDHLGNSSLENLPLYVLLLIDREITTHLHSYAELKKYIPTVKILANGHIRNGISKTIYVVLLREILFEDIVLVEKAIESIEFSFDYDGILRVRCRSKLHFELSSASDSGRGTGAQCYSKECPPKPPITNGESLTTWSKSTSMFLTLALFVGQLV